ncbi:MAG: hypothetical protein ABI349_16205 [Casimicrobiaceae bacterium]
MNDNSDSVNDALDAALEMTFPASDPIAVFMRKYDAWGMATAKGECTAQAGIALDDERREPPRSS